MKKILTIAIIAILASSLLHAQEKSGAKIEYTQTIYDYDTIVQGSDGLCTFTFRNTGGEPLIISSASSSCGCTTPEYGKKPVMPGKSGEIKVRYDTGTLGSFRKTVVVKSNAANAPTSVLRIKGFVREKRNPAGGKPSETFQ